MPPQQRITMQQQQQQQQQQESNSDDDDNSESPTAPNRRNPNATMRRVVSNVQISVGGDRTSNNGNDYKVRKSSLIG
jgi:hypothetical protein